MEATGQIAFHVEIYVTRPEAATLGAIESDVFAGLEDSDEDGDAPLLIGAGSPPTSDGSNPDFIAASQPAAAIPRITSTFAQPYIEMGPLSQRDESARSAANDFAADAPSSPLADGSTVFLDIQAAPSRRNRRAAREAALKNAIHQGRPNLEAIFVAATQKAANSATRDGTIAMVCGPESLIDCAADLARKRGAAFHYEVFSF